MNMSNVVIKRPVGQTAISLLADGQWFTLDYEEDLQEDVWVKLDGTDKYGRIEAVNLAKGKKGFFNPDGPVYPLDIEKMELRYQSEK